MKHLDKLLHFSLCFMLVLFFSLFLNIFIASIVVLIIGVVKEFKDSKFDYYDLLADIIGIVLAIIYLKLKGL